MTFIRPPPDVDTLGNPVIEWGLDHLFGPNDPEDPIFVWTNRQRGEGHWLYGEDARRYKSRQRELSQNRRNKAYMKTQFKTLTPAAKIGVPGWHEDHKKWIFKPMPYPGFRPGGSPYRSPYKNRRPTGYNYKRFYPAYSGRPGFQSARTLFKNQARTYYSRNRRTGGFTGIEKKFLDHQRTVAPIPTTTAGAEVDPTTVNCFNAIPSGAAEGQRIGTNCKIVSWHLKGSVEMDAQASALLVNGKAIRLIALIDKQTNGAQFNSEDVLLDTTNPEYAFRNLQQAGRFRILKDFTWTLNASNAAGDGAVNDVPATVRSFKWNFNMRLPVHYKSSTPSVADITTNSLHLMAIASGGTCTLRYESRIRYIE